MNYNPEQVAKELAERLCAPEFKESIKLELEIAHNSGGLEAIQKQLDSLQVATGDK
jgi:hypothetical protein